MIHYETKMPRIRSNRTRTAPASQMMDASPMERKYMADGGMVGSRGKSGGTGGTRSHCDYGKKKK